VFRSSRNGGGIYVTPVLGGEPVLVAPKGFRPRFSPDGKSIAYWVGSEGGPVGGVFVISAFGGEPRRIGADLKSAYDPVWSPDGKWLMVRGWQTIPGSREDFESNWWVVSLEDEAARSSGFAEVLRRQNLRWYGTDPGVWARDGRWIVFAGRTGDSSNLYRVRVSGESGEIVGDAERITFGTGIETKPALSAGGQLALATEVVTSHLWSVPADTNRLGEHGPRGDPGPAPHMILGASTSRYNRLASDQTQGETCANRVESWCACPCCWRRASLRRSP
jgi:hypothetical protein